MQVAGLQPAERREITQQVERILHGRTFQNSESLRKLLQYLGDQAVQHPGALIKEYQIAVDVFGRPADFDSRLDAIVRVQTSRLRTKLSEYYAREGVSDPVIVDLPKGSYSLSVHHPTPAAVAPAAEPVSPTPLAAAAAPPEQPRSVAPAIVEPVLPPAPQRDWRNIALLVLGLLVACTGSLCVSLFMKQTIKTTAPAAHVSPEVEFFWRNFVDRGEKPLVVFSNAEFVGRPEYGMRYFDPKRDRREDILDHYSGTGEVIGVQELSYLLYLLGRPPRIKRGRLLSIDDVKNSDVVFIGSPRENLSLRELPSLQDFVFTKPTATTDNPTNRPDNLIILNRHPQPGEPSQFTASSALPLVKDYAVVSLLPGLTASRWMLVLAGTSTLGTQAAVEYACRQSSVADLVRRAQRTDKKGMAPFEAVIEVKISSGVPVQMELIALHRHDHE